MFRSAIQPCVVNLATSTTSRHGIGAHAHVRACDTVTLCYPSHWMDLRLLPQYPDLESSVRTSGDLGPRWQWTACVSDLQASSAVSPRLGCVSPSQDKNKPVIPCWACVSGCRWVGASFTSEACDLVKRSGSKSNRQVFSRAAVNSSDRLDIRTESHLLTLGREGCHFHGCSLVL